MKPLRDFVPENPHFVVAHRGSSGTAPENTLAAIREAIAAGAKMVEIDVQCTADHQVVLFHDQVIGRTTTGHGKTHALLYSELQHLDAGSWFDKQFSNERVPLLREALHLLRQNECYVNIEIKPPTPNEDIHERTDMILSVVKECDMVQNTLFGSFHHASLRYLKQHYPETHTAAINVPGDTRLPSVIAQECGCEAFVCSLKECTHKRMDDAQAHGIYTGVYTINTAKELQTVLRYPVAAIVTNFPARIIGEMKKSA